MVTLHEYDVISVTETWATAEIGDAELSIEGFSMYRVDRNVTRGGGVVLYIKENLRSSVDNKMMSENFEDSVWCSVKANGTKLLIGVCYRSPQSSKENNAKLLSVMDKAVNQSGYDRILIMGDFNFRDIDYSTYSVNAGDSSDAYKFFNKTQDLYLIQHVTETTRKRSGAQETVLDYIFTNEDNLVDNLQYLTPLGKSDHVCLVWDYVVSVTENTSKQRKFNYWKGNYVLINEELKSYDWNQILMEHTTDDAWTKFKDILHKAIEKHVPEITVKKSKATSHQWMTKATRRSITRRNTAWRKYRQLKTDANYATYKRLRNETNRKVKADQLVYRKKILKSFKGNPKKFYGYMRRVKTVKEKVHQVTNENGQLTETEEETAQALGNFFSSVFVQENGNADTDEDSGKSKNSVKLVIDEDTVMNKLLKLKIDKAQGPDDIHPSVLRNCAQSVAQPLTIIYRKSLEEGILPKDWKMAVVVPIFKKGKKHEASNYRPVSLTSVPCKVLESIIRDAVVIHLEEQNFYADCQHGFMKGRSTLTNLLVTLECWTSILEDGSGLDVIYLDYKKAFDTVPHQKLLQKLKGLKLGDTLTKWIGQFLLGRQMRVHVNGSFSSWINVISGVPQGSVLGPLLFLIFVNDLSDWVKGSILMFADDTKIWAKIKDTGDSDLLQQDLNMLMEWSKQWLLAFNTEKCKVMHIGHELPTVYTMSDGNITTQLETITVEKDLGVYITSNLKPTEQCIQAAKKAQSVLGMVHRQFKIIDKEDFGIIYKTYIRPHLEYCIQAWSPNLQKDKMMLEKVQRRATRMVKGLKKLPYETRLKKLGLYSLERRRLRGDLIETFKILTGKERVNCSKFFELADVTSGLRGHSLKLFKPRCHTTIRQNFFSSRIVNEWNKLPQEVIDAPSINAFKNRLDRHWHDMGIFS